MGAVSSSAHILLHVLHGLHGRSHPLDDTCIHRELSSVTWSFSTSSRTRTRIESGSLRDGGRRSTASTFPRSLPQTVDWAQMSYEPKPYENVLGL